MRSISLNPHIRNFVCSLTSTVQTVMLEGPIGLCSCCPAPGRPLEVHYDLQAAQADFPTKTGSDGMWRYQALLPVQNPGDDFAGDVGGTPHLCAPGFSEALDCDVWIKQEGGNPSGSFKDRGLAMAVALGCGLGARRFCLPTQGNAGVAASLFSARMGIEPCLVYMPENYVDSIYHRAAAHFGAEIRFFGANIAAAGGRMRDEQAAELAAGKLVDVSTFFEPGRLEGKKTMGFEIAEFFEHGLPEFIIYPTGGGTGLVGIFKAFRELQGMGLLSGDLRLPAMIAVQSSNCAPVVAAFARNLQQVEPVVSRGTIADGMDVPGAIMGHRILATLRESGGCAIAVSEQEIIDAYRQLAGSGIAAGYEGSSTLAALSSLRKQGVVPAGSRVLLLNTSSHQVSLDRPMTAA